MAINLHLFPDAGDLAITVDQHRGALYAHVCLAIHALLLPHAVSFQYGLGLVGGKNHSEIVFFNEPVVAFDVIRGNANDRCVDGGELIRQRGEGNGFVRAGRRIVFRIEEEDDRAATEMGERHGIAAIARQGEFRSRRAGGDFGLFG